MSRFIHRRKQTKTGQPYLKVVDTHTEKTYIYRVENADTDLELAVPSTVGATDSGGLERASDYLDRKGFTIYLDGLHPTHFDYDGAVTKA